jgi:small subunit ribosomal protein S1
VGEVGYRHDLESDWEQAPRLFETKEQVHLEVVGYDRGGVLVNVGQIQGFVPASQLRALPDDVSTQ